ncbi:tRNA (adenosine(37)-N6)-threonylcarbamoyltransferase complex ATPase subunit type 1 TsaE [Rhodospirillum rubrum]|uniref:tRNA (adenosine(37)-N6)-threonylcarbamoyltransferase complex ATPase subunit type 1 TsaE n=1 Tax=Rhodospirillum rubrum TaxID=1085 RepID=UPI001904A1DF|nr:tRNA (adenosine(37)-N6)-threonylcarbamoyltransferase complex ATPase subunit type 1 TsaE [Rhodospirillum rubrum]MBK1666217.1 tRNA (adenosine(37)-N6)-threonylcarbamoyltransferase complex ATPase subunit type 1 TsaE [Rhodospirillum rubrum]MBK1678363.1 tRNA (adenosine(37)-N6)-threonylcarbamoyltransferase complex ATPase subunit type 1 TsaE [Rhodospirillum rubrum]
MSELSLFLPDPSATDRLGAALARVVRGGDVLALIGDLGAGKSALARALIRALTTPDEEVPSPTFTLVQTYDPADGERPMIWHFDLYRLDDPEEALALAIEDAFAEGISLIEWPDRLGALLPADRLDIRLGPDASGAGRIATLSERGRWAGRLPAEPAFFPDPPPR